MRGVSGGDPADGARSGVPRRRLATARRWGSAPALRPLYGRGARSALGPIRMFSPAREKRPPGPKSPRWSAERRASPRDAGASHAPWARRKARSAGAAAPARYLGAPPPLISGARSQKQNPCAKNAPHVCEWKCIQVKSDHHAQQTQSLPSPLWRGSARSAGVGVGVGGRDSVLQLRPTPPTPPHKQEGSRPSGWPGKGTTHATHGAAVQASHP